MKMLKRLSELYDRFYRKSRQYCCFIIVIPIAGILACSMAIAGTTMALQACGSALLKIRDEIENVKNQENKETSQLKPNREEYWLPKNKLEMLDYIDMYHGNHEGGLLS